MVVGRGHRHDLRHAQLLQPARGRPGRGPAGRPIAPVATIVPWPGISRGTEATVPMPPGLVSVMLRAHVGVGLQLVVAGAHHQLVVGGHELRRSPSSEAFLITGTTSEREPSLRSRVHRQAQAHRAGGHAVGLAVHLGEGVRHHRHVVGGAHDRPGDQVGEGELLAGGLELGAVGPQRRRRAGCGSWWRWGSSGSRP